MKPAALPSSGVGDQYCSQTLSTCAFHPSACENRAVPVFPQLGHLKFSTQWSRTIILQICACGCPVQAGFSSNGAEHDVRERIVLLKEIIMPQGNRDRSTAETGEQIPRRPHDSGSQANET